MSKKVIQTQITGSVKTVIRRNTEWQEFEYETYMQHRVSGNWVSIAIGYTNDKPDAVGSARFEHNRAIEMVDSGYCVPNPALSEPALIAQ